MPYTLTPFPEQKYLLIKVTGETNRQLALEYHRAARQRGDELGFQAYLVDLTESRNTDTALRHYKFVTHDFQAVGLHPAARIALLVDPFDHSHDFLEILLKHAGIEASLFQERDLAIHYLTQPAPLPPV
jgi:hypothetical protein